MARAGGLPLPTITDDRALGAADIQRSFRFSRASSTHLERTFGTNTSNTKKTVSFWMKRGNQGSYQTLFGTTASGYIEGRLQFTSAEELQFVGRDASDGTTDVNKVTTRKFRDSTSWYHIVLALDSTDSTADDRVKIYVNGVQETSFSSSTNPPSSYSFSFYRSSVANFIGANDSSDFFDGYLTEINFIDGQQLDSSYFGFTDSQTGIWMPKRYEGTYGTNGFYLDFSDNSSITNMMIDKSPNGNDWSPDNCNTEDSMLDTPSNNFATLRMAGTPAASGSGLTEGNLEFTTGTTGSGGNSNRLPFNTISPTSGKWYVEVHPTTTNLIFIGVHPYQVGIVPTGGATRWQGLYSYNGEDYLASTSSTASNSTYAASYGQPDIIGIYMDMDASPPQVYFSKNGQWANGSGSWNQSTPTGAITLGGTFFTTSTGGFEGIGINIRSASSSTNTSAQANFGQDSTFSGFTAAGGYKDSAGIGDFKYPVPANALAICSANLSIPTPSIRPQRHFSAVIYSGDSNNNTKIGLEFKPDFVWIKNRTEGSSGGVGDNMWFDSIRGALTYLSSNSHDNAETSNSNGLQQFLPDGFRPGSMTRTNESGDNYVAWCWKAGGAAVANTDGSITTSVSVNQEAGFSIVSWTGTNGTGTIGHGLGKTPKWVVIRRRNSQSSWVVYHNSIGNTKRITLDTTNDADGDNSAWFNNTSPTSTTVSLGADGGSNGSTDNYIAWCWAEIPGYSKFGSYKGNNNADGPHIHLGFRPAWVMIKNVNANGTEWYILDNKRDTSNPMGQYLSASSHAAEATYVFYDFLSDGFKLRNTGSAQNPSGETIIYMAFAEQPDATPFDTFPNAR